MQQGEYNSLITSLIIFIYYYIYYYLLLLTVTQLIFFLQNLRSFAPRESNYTNFRDFIRLINFTALRDILDDTCLTLGVIIWHIEASQCAPAHVYKQEEKEKPNGQPFARERTAGLTDQFILFLLFSFLGWITRFRGFCNPLLSSLSLVHTNARTIKKIMLPKNRSP